MPTVELDAQATTLIRHGDLAGAEPLYRELAGRDFGTGRTARLNHAVELTGLGECLGRPGNPDGWPEALDRLRDALAIRASLLGPQAPATARTARALAIVLDRAHHPAAESAKVRADAGLPPPATTRP